MELKRLVSAGEVIREALACKCCGKMPPDVDPLLHLAEWFAAVCPYDTVDSVVITSAYRCEANNKKCGGSPKSQHLAGLALDLYSEEYMRDIVKNIMANGYDKEVNGFGLYPPNRVHIDSRSGKGRWSVIAGTMTTFEDGLCAFGVGSCGHR